MAEEPKNDSPEERPEEGAPGEAAAEEQFFAAGEAAGGSEVDPELMRIPKPARRRRHPLIAVVVILLGAYLVLFLREDFLFFFQSRQPVDLGEVAAALKAGRLRHNTYVTLRGAPDRKHALILEGRMGGYDSFFRLLDTRSRVFVQQHREMRLTDDAVSSTHTGQLVRFSNLPYAKNVRAYLREAMTVAHDLPFKEVKRGLSARGGTTLTDVKGEQVTLTDDSLLWVNVAFPNEWVVQFGKQFYEQPTAAAAKMKEFGLPFAPEDEPSKLFWRFVVLAEPDQVPLLMARAKDPALHAGVVRRQVSYSARWSQLRVQGDTLVINAADPTFPSRFLPAAGNSADPAAPLRPVKEPTVKVPAESVLFISTSSPFEVPADAMVLVTGTAPGDKWFYVLLYVVLLGFIVVNTVSLLLRLRDRRAS